jgi:hypothetical protein
MHTKLDLNQNGTERLELYLCYRIFELYYQRDNDTGLVYDCAKYHCK